MSVEGKSRRLESKGRRWKAAGPLMLFVVTCVHASGAQTIEHPTSDAPRLTFDLNGRLFRVPFPYLATRRDTWPWGRAEPQKPEPYDAFEFAFWISDGKPTVKGRSSTPTFWPVESGRPRAGSEDFAVWVQRVSVVLAGDIGRPGFGISRGLPRERFEGEIKFWKTLEGQIQWSEHGLDCYSAKPMNGTSKAVCWKSYPDLDVLLESYFASPSLGNPHWRMYLYEPRSHLFLDILFPRAGEVRRSGVHPSGDRGSEIVNAGHGLPRPRPRGTGARRRYLDARPAPLSWAE